MKTQVMLDLETFGQRPGAVIVAIGAAQFGDGAIHRTFYERVTAESCVRVGLKLDASTVKWWLGQSDAARQEILRPGIDILMALARFEEWLDDPEAEVWGNGASFDCSILGAAYDCAGVRRPWKYHNERCYRTVKNLFPDITMERSGTHHNALDDAISQAKHLMEIVREMLCPARIG